MNWQPIDTAPTDGTPLWLVEPGEPLGLDMPHQFCGQWVKDPRFVGGGHWQDVALMMFIAHPTHWMPLPEPPK